MATGGRRRSVVFVPHDPARAELAARRAAGMASHVLVATAGGGYALHCSDERVAAVVIAACDAAAIETRRDGTVVTARAGLQLAA
jgi:hypothetical protein